jgi:ribose-phosphate pyrophosphokinase
MPYSIVFVPDLQQDSFEENFWSKDTTLIAYKKHVFPDGECYFTLSNYDNIAGEKVLLIYQLKHFEGGYSTNDQLFKLLLLCRTINQLAPFQIDLLLPYFPYARQEKKVNQNILPTVSLTGEIFYKAGIANIISCDLHSDIIRKLIPATLLSFSMRLFWKEHIKKNISLENTCIVFPDKGAYSRTLQIATLLNIEHIFLKKQRMEEQRVIFSSLGYDFSGKNVVVIDDIIDTANTAIGACDMVKKQGAENVFGCFTHAVLSSNSIEKLKKSKYRKIYITNSIMHDKKRLPENFVVLEIYKFLISNLRIKKKGADISSIPL